MSKWPGLLSSSITMFMINEWQFTYLLILTSIVFSSSLNNMCMHVEAYRATILKVTCNSRCFSCVLLQKYGVPHSPQAQDAISVLLKFNPNISPNCYFNLPFTWHHRNRSSVIPSTGVQLSGWSDQLSIFRCLILQDILHYRLSLPEEGPLGSEGQLGLVIALGYLKKCPYKK